MSERLEPAVLGELLGLLAHDLRNPLSALHSNLGFLKSVTSSADPELLEAIDDSVVSCEGLAHIIDNIDLIGRSFRDHPSSSSAGAEIQPLVEAVIAASERMAQSHGVRIQLEPLPRGAAVSRGARELLDRAITNLVRNSVQHSPTKGTVTVSARLDATGFVVTIADNGSRLPTSGNDLAFTATGQVRTKSTPNGRYSRGLGLYCAGLAAAASHAAVRIVDPPPGANNAFEIAIELRK